MLARRSPTPRRLLIVEHDDSMGTFATRVLRRAGFETTHVETSEEALVALAAEPWDGVLADAQLPGMSGVDLAAEVREAYPDLAIAIIIGSESAATEPLLESCRADALLARPLTPTGLAERIRELFAADEGPDCANGAG
jgi:DNA-binding response OmpR family regulator